MKPLIVQRPFGKNTFYALGCAHRPIGETDLWKAWIKEVRADKNAFALLCGDTLDFARTHYREHLRSYRSDRNSQIAIDKWVGEEVEEVARDLRPIRDKIVGAILGNHAHETVDGINSEQLLCQKLGIPYLGVMGALRLDFMEGETRRHTLTLVAHHTGGSRSAGSAGADVKQLENFEAKWDADIYVLSHTHRRLAHKVPQLAVQQRGEPRVIERTKVLIRTGTLLKGYGEDSPRADRPHFPSYAEEAAYRPTDLGWVRCEIGMHKDGEGRVKVDYRLTV